MHIFSGEGIRFSAVGIFDGDNFPWGEIFPGVEFFRGNFTRGDV
jgi:hypothetical protein